MAHDRRLDVGQLMGFGALKLRPFQEGDEASILRILKEGSGLGCSLDEWAWLFSPEEDGRAIVVGEREDEVVAVCSGTPVDVVVDGRDVPAVELRKLAARDRNDMRRILDHFGETFGSSGRFALMTASFASEGEAPPGFEEAPYAGLVEMVRTKPVSRTLRRFVYRAEPGRDWEPRLDGLWERVRNSYPVAVVRNADRALRRFAGHPSVRHHRFLVFPRHSDTAVASAVFVDIGLNCCWLDLLWDHAHPGALELLAHISGRLVNQWGGGGERIWLAGDDAAKTLLADRGFRSQTSSQRGVAIRSLTPELDARDLVARAYLTAADAGGLSS